MWSWIGVGCSLAGALLASRRAHAPATNFYERDVYAMTQKTHWWFTAIGAAFALAFLLGMTIPDFPTIPLLAVYTVLLIGYLSSFLRGATGEDE